MSRVKVPTTARTEQTPNGYSGFADVEGADWALCCMVNVSNTTSVVAGGVVVFAGVDTYCTVRRMVEHLVSNGCKGENDHV